MANWKNWIATCPRCKKRGDTASCSNCHAPLIFSKSYDICLMECQNKCGSTTLLTCDACGTSINPEKGKWIKPKPSAIMQRVVLAILVVLVVAGVLRFLL